MAREEKNPKTMTVLLGLGKSKKYQYISGKEGTTVYSAEEVKKDFDAIYPDVLSEKDRMAEKEVLKIILFSPFVFSISIGGFFLSFITQ